MRALALVALLAACDKGPGDPRAPIVEAWKSGGLAPSALEVAKTDVGADCKAGVLNAVELMLCVYPTAEEAKAAHDKGLAWVGDATGAAKVSGTVLVVVADRRKVDPSGKTINQLLKLLPE
ncbi:MAG: hypothetical protein AB7T06_15945 [Kofleriaceae bacterium]